MLGCTNASQQLAGLRAGAALSTHGQPHAEKTKIVAHPRSGIVQAANSPTQPTGDKRSKSAGAISRFYCPHRQTVHRMKENNQYPFPFFGAGDAEYYEWAGLTIRFKQAPTEKEQKQISTGAPKVWEPKDHGYHGRILSVISDQFVNRWIEEAYGQEGEGEDDPFEEDSEFYASDAAKTAFEKDIERWLTEIHRICPIEFVYRSEDGEAGGTALSAWHDHSVEQTRQLTAQWGADPALTNLTGDETGYFREAVTGILDFAGINADELDEPLAGLLDPAATIRKLLEAGDPAAISDYLRKIKAQDHETAHHDEIQQAIDRHCEQLCEDRQYESIYTLHFLFGKTILLGAPIGPFIYAAWLKQDHQLIKETLEQIGHPCDMTNNIGHFVINDLFPQQKWPDAIQLFRIAINNKSPKPCTLLEVYCNALYVLQNDNTGLPIDKTLNEAFLAICLPYAPKNPAIYFNAACLYVEMKDFEKTLECIQLAKKHKFDGYDGMLEAIDSGGIFAEFLHYPPFQKWRQ